MNILARLEKLEKSRDFWLVFVSSLLFFILRFPSLFEPNWYGDEGIYQVIGFAMRHGRILYSGIYDNKPPLLYVLYAAMNGDQFGAKLLSLIFGILSIVALFFLAKRLLGKPLANYSATIVFALFFGLPLLEGNIANAENFILLPIILGALLVTHELKTPKVMLLAGLLLGIAFLFKIVALFDMAAFTLFLAISYFSTKQLLTKEEKVLMPFFVGFVLPLILTTLYFVLHASVGAFFKAAFFENVGYVKYGNKFIIPQGLLILKLLLLGGFTLLLFKRRSKIPSAVLFIFLWAAFSLFSAFFSQRPYTHYLLLLLPSFSLLIGLCFFEKKWQRPGLFVLLITVLLVGTNFTFYKKTVSYYGNFAEFLQDKKDIHAYESFFDTNVPRDYAVSEYLKTHADKNSLYIWGNDAQIYKLVDVVPPGRYTVAYHAAASKATRDETDQVISNIKPKTFVLMPTSQDVSFSLTSYHEKIHIGNAIIYERNTQ